VRRPTTFFVQTSVSAILDAVNTIFPYRRLAVVDLETTGTAATADSITEIGIVLIEQGAIVEEWSSLINPEVPIPPEIQALTGITDAMVRAAPTFRDVADDVLLRLRDALFVAHNARFDYAFLKNAFRRLGVAYTADVLCTVRLSRKLYPDHASHSLDALIMRHRLHDEERHRALGDARLAWRFIETALREHAHDHVGAVVKSLLKMPSLPPQLDVDALANLPEGPGVYLFYGVNDLPIYIGKSVNLRDRVRSHFSSDHRQSNDVRLSMEIRRIGFEETAGEFGALLREAELIKRVMPLRNLRLRRNAQLVFVKLDDVSQPVEIVPLADIDLGNTEGLYGPFTAKARAKAMLLSLAADNALCWKALGAQSIDGPCFARQIKRCRGFCEGLESLAAHNLRLAEALRAHAFPAWPYAHAIGIRETHPEHGWQRVHVFDQWCYLGTGCDEAEVAEVASRRAEAEFDVDIFRLLRKKLAQHASASDDVFAIGCKVDAMAD
jgi:DNA polymerase III subunit epsilon